MPPVRAGLIALLAALAAACLAPVARANPLDGNGMWIWYVSASGGSARAIATKAHHHDIRTVLVKSGDAGNYWSQFSPEFVSRLHRRGLRVCAWQFVYGSSPRAEALVGAHAVANGADCLVIDAEGSYEGRYAAADRYIRVLRRRVGRDYPLALAAFPYVDYHPSFPYSVFLGRRGAQYNAPQMYWHTIGTSVGSVYGHTYRFNRPYQRRLYPLGQTYQDPGRRDLRAFRRYGREFSAQGVSWWSWQETQGKEWRWATRRPRHGIAGFNAKVEFPALREGKRGDLVVLLQELLRSAGADSLPVTGYFGSKTERATRRFQTDNGLTVSGIVRKPTWRVLLQREPKWVSWSRRSSKRGTPAAPRSASLPAKAYEIPSGLGAG